MNDLAGVLLAAGDSSRLGSSKQLLDIAGEPLVRRQAALLTGACDRVVVVTGAGAAQVADAVEGLGVRCVFNPQWRDGMGSSLARGVRAAGDAQAVLVLLVDQWRVNGTDLATLRTTARNHPGQAVAARWDGCDAGVPAVFPATLFDRLQALDGDIGARRILADAALDVVTVELPGAAFDLDTPEDLAAFESGRP